MHLTKSQTKELRQAATRHGRRKTGLFLCEGLRACTEAWQARRECVERVLVAAASGDGDPAIREILRGCERHGIEVFEVSSQELAGFAATEKPQGILFLCRRFQPESPVAPLPGPFVLVLDRVGDPGNMGTILRTAWAVGVQEVWLTAGTADPFSPKVIRAGMGAQFRLNIRERGALPELSQELHQLGAAPAWLSDPAAGISCYSPDFTLEGASLVIGSEAHGVSDLSDAPRVHIPMPGGAESLNAAQAATILMFESVRRGTLM